MSRTLKRRSPLIATVVAVGVSLAVCAVALAHYLVSGTATCTGATAQYTQFNDNEKPITYRVLVDNVQVAAGTGTFVGSSGPLSATYPPLAAGDHTVRWESTWPGQGNENGSFQQVVKGCPGPPAPPPSTTPPPPTPPATTPPAPPTSVPPTSVPPKQQTKHEHRRFGTKRTKRCVHGRKHLRDSHGRRFTVCVQHGKAPVTRTPKFTG